LKSGTAYPPAALAWSVWGLGGLLYLIAFYQRVAPAVITDRLMTDFAIGAAALGNLSAFYFYSYVAMQIPTGIIADRWGPRKLLTVGAAVAALGTALFAAAPDLWWANAGRLLVGASVAVAFVSMLKLAGHWFAPRHFPLVSGMALFVGIVGAVFAGRPLRAMVEAYGWREVMAVSAAITAALAVVIWLRVRDDPADSGYASHFVDDHGESGHASVWSDLAEVLSYRNTWLLFFTPGGIAGAVLTFAGLWGVPYFTHVYGMAPKEAALLTSTLLVAWAVGGPLLGTASQRLGRRKPLYVASCALVLAGWSVFVFLPPLPLPALIALLLALGFFSGCMIIGFAFIKESVPARLTGTASGLINTGVMIGAMVLQPAVGLMLDRNWHGKLSGAVRLYDLAAYQAGFALMLAWVLLSLILISLSRETYCKPIA
jgi:MFS family permease